MNPSPLAAVIVAPTTEPTTTTANPIATVSFAPIREVTRSAVTAPTISPPTAGRRRSPEPCGSTPRIAWKYWGSPNSTPNNPKTPSEVRSTPHVKLRERKSERSMSGSPSGWAVSRRSQSTNTASTASPAATGPMALALPQPSSPAFTTPYMRATSPALESTTPTRSMPGRLADLDSGTSASTATRPRRATGTFTRKIQPHQTWLSIQPPTIGPSGRPMKFAAPQMPIARGRSASAKRTVMIESTITITVAPARPRATRAAMNTSGLGA